MTSLRILLICLLAGSLVVAACGKKGAPNRPEPEKQEKKTT